MKSSIFGLAVLVFAAAQPVRGKDKDKSSDLPKEESVAAYESEENGKADGALSVTLVPKTKTVKNGRGPIVRAHGSEQ